MTTDTLAAAILAFQADLPSIGKDNTATVPTKSGGTYKYTYADLTSITEIVFPKLTALGLSWVTMPNLVDGKNVLRYSLRHVKGEELTGDFPLPADTTPQTLGSAITYARRYALCAVLGLAPANEDDDGAAASTPKPPAKAATPVPPVGTPPAEWRKKIDDARTPAELQDYYESEARHWFTDEVKKAFSARKAVLAAKADL